MKQKNLIENLKYSLPELLDVCERVKIEHVLFNLLNNNSNDPRDIVNNFKKLLENFRCISSIQNGVFIICVPKFNHDWHCYMDCNCSRVLSKWYHIFLFNIQSTFCSEVEDELHDRYCRDCTNK
jgi:hypothetical protein